VSFTSLPPSTDKQGIDPALAFRLLGLWQGPSISAAAAAALFGVPEYSAEDALEVLVDTHLLESVTTDRYRFHDLLRVYAAERAADDVLAAERDAAVTRLLTWYMRTAGAAATAVSPRRFNIAVDGPDEDDVAPLAFAAAEEALAWYDSERANLVSATRQAAGSGQHDVAWRLPTPLFMIFESRGNWADCIATHRIALDSARLVGNRQAEAWVLNNLGDALGVTGHPEGIGYLEQSLAIRREIGDRMGEVHSANNLADAYQRLGRADEALDVLWRVLDLTREVADRFGEGVALVNVGSALLDLDRPEEAVGYLQQARHTFTQVDYVDGVGYAMHILGRCYLSMGRDTEALDSLRLALDSHRASGNRQRQAATLKSLGTAQSRAGLAAEARESWSRAAAIFEELGDSAQAAEVRPEQAISGIS
jgi:tetratricopeptide (TPR) repeat protein